MPGCIGLRSAPPIVLAADVPCSRLVPTQWVAAPEDGGGVAHAPEPEKAAPAPVANPSTVDDWRRMYEWALVELKKWTGYAVAETQKVEDANGRARDQHQITSECEKRDAAAIKAATKKRGIF